MCGSGFYNPGPVSQSNTGRYVEIPTCTTTAQTIDFNIILQLGTPFSAGNTQSQDIFIASQAVFEFVCRCDLTVARDEEPITVAIAQKCESGDGNRNWVEPESDVVTAALAVVESGGLPPEPLSFRLSLLC